MTVSMTFLDYALPLNIMSIGYTFGYQMEWIG